MRLKRLDRLVARHHACARPEVGLRELVHLRLELREVFRRERPLEGEVVVEAVLDHRADGDLRFRVHRLHGLREQVRGGVADDLEAVRVLAGDDRERCASWSMTIRGVDELAVDRPASAALARPAPMLGSDLRPRSRLVEAALAAVGQGDDRHRLGPVKIHDDPGAGIVVGARGIEPRTPTMSR